MAGLSDILFGGLKLTTKVKNPYRVYKNYRLIRKLPYTYTGMPSNYAENFMTYNGPIWTTNNLDVAKLYAKGKQGFGNSNGQVFKIIDLDNGQRTLDVPPPEDEGYIYDSSHIPYKINKHGELVQLNLGKTLLPVDLSHPYYTESVIAPDDTKGLYVAAYIHPDGYDEWVGTSIDKLHNQLMRASKRASVYGEPSNKALRIDAISDGVGFKVRPNPIPYFNQLVYNSSEGLLKYPYNWSNARIAFDYTKPTILIPNYLLYGIPGLIGTGIGGYYLYNMFNNK